MGAMAHERAMAHGRACPVTHDQHDRVKLKTLNFAGGVRDFRAACSHRLDVDFITLLRERTNALLFFAPPAAAAS